MNQSNILNKNKNISIAIVCTGQPSANPRLIKEAIAFFSAGYDITVIYCPTSPWADEFDYQIFKQFPKIKWIKVGYHPLHNKILYHLSRLKRKLSEYLFRIVGDKFQLPEMSLVLFIQELIKVTCAVKADLYIGHNLGSLPAVIKASSKNQSSASFDFEDYHRGENKPESFQTKLNTLVENKYVPKLNYATAASPLIAQAYNTHFPDLSIHIINNSFPPFYASETLKILPKSPLKLFWFSQYIGKKRGLEQVIAAIGKSGNKHIQLTLLGNCSDEMRMYLLNEAITHQLTHDQVKFLPSVSEKEIIQIASQHHIGLAVEVPHVQNRELCLTNKIFIYLLAGNAIVFSDTKAQQEFFLKHKVIGSMFLNNSIDGLTLILSSYATDAVLLQRHRQASFDLGKSLNWDAEKEILLRIVKEHFKCL